MGIFDSINASKQSKLKHIFDVTKFYKKGRFATSVDSNYFENISALHLLDLNKKRKFNNDIIALWGKLAMKFHIDFDFGTTINPYFSNQLPMKEVEDYNFMHEHCMKFQILDIKYTKKIVLENIVFLNIFFVTCEIMDNNNTYRPYIEMYIKDDLDDFYKIGYGYDSNHNRNVELFIDGFNYPLFLDNKGIIHSPLKNHRYKIKVNDYLIDTDIKKIDKK